METLIIVLLSIVLIAVVILIIQIQSQKKSNQLAIANAIRQEMFNDREQSNTQFSSFTDRMDNRILDLSIRNTEFERHLNKNLGEFYQGLNNSVTKNYQEQSVILERRLNQIDQKVNESLSSGFEKTNQTFTNIVERLSKIDEAQKKIDSLSVEIVSLQSVLTDKKTRGTFGEVQLAQILSAIFGEKNDRIFKLQYTFSTGNRSDAAIFAPEPLGTLAIDAKFPLENYRKMIDAPVNSYEYQQARQLFIADCKKHIDDIARKYIISGETADQALMFIPAEAIFAQINAYHAEVLDYAQRKKVWIVSPTTLMSTLTTLQTILINIERDKYASVIQEELRLLNIEFERYRSRWDALSTHLDQVGKDVKDIHVTTKKITNRFESIASVETLKIDEE